LDEVQVDIVMADNALQFVQNYCSRNSFHDRSKSILFKTSLQASCTSSWYMVYDVVLSPCTSVQQIHWSYTSWFCSRRIVGCYIKIASYVNAVT